MVRMKKQVAEGDSKEDEVAADDGKDDKAGRGRRQQGE
jgi:hypothetical protein